MNLLTKIIAGVAVLWGLITGQPAVQPQTFGTNAIPVQTQKTTLAGAGVGLTDTSIILQSFATPDGTKITMSNFGTIGYATLEPGGSKEENISFTGITQNANNTATLTGVVRGLGFVYPYSASAALQKTHAGGSTLVISNSAVFYSSFAFWGSTTTITGNWTFTSSSIPVLDTGTSTVFTTSSQLITKGYADQLAFNGAPNASFSTQGLVQLATTSQLIAGTATSGLNLFLVPANQYFNTTSSASNIVPVTGSNGKLSQGFLDLTQGWTFTGTTTLSGAVNVQGLAVTSSSFVKFGGDGSDGALLVQNGVTTTIDLATSSVVTKNYTSITITSTSTLGFIQPAPTGTIIILRSQGACNIAGTIFATSTGGNGAPQAAFNTAGAVGSSSIDFYVAHGGGGGTVVGGDGGGGGGSSYSDGVIGSASGGTAGAAGKMYAGSAFYKTQNFRAIRVAPGSGGGGGGGGSNAGSAKGGAGGIGGGGLYIECAGAWNFTGTITTAGQVGGNGDSTAVLNANAGGGGGGGAAGDIFVLYGSLTADSGTYTTTGGAGGSGGAATNGGTSGQNGGAGAASTAVRQKNNTF